MEETAASFTERVANYLSARHGFSVHAQKPGQIDPQSLTFKTLLHTAAFYAPQDAALLASTAILADRERNKLNPPHIWDHPTEALSQFKLIKGLKDSDITLTRRKGVLVLGLAK